MEALRLTGVVFGLMSGWGLLSGLAISFVPREMSGDARGWTILACVILPALMAPMMMTVSFLRRYDEEIIHNRELASMRREQEKFKLRQEHETGIDKYLETSSVD